MKKSLFVLSLVVLLGLVACKKAESSSDQTPATTQEQSKDSTSQSSTSDPSVEESPMEGSSGEGSSDGDKQMEFAAKSLDEQTKNNLQVMLRNYTAQDADLLTEYDRRFQFYKTDLNGDGQDEIFVRLMGPYFCGSGGCTFLLLDKYGEIITKFSVTRAPIFIEPTKKNGWSILLVKDRGELKELVFDQGSYPSNPSVLPKAPYDAPSGHAEIIFSEEFNPSQTFEY